MYNELSNNNIFITKLFLSLFNLSIETNDYYDISKDHIIVDKDNNKVGTFYYKDNSIVLNANINNNKLTAQIHNNDITNIEDDLDKLDIQENNIEYQLLSNNNKILGNLQINIINDSEYGKRIESYSTINYSNSDSEDITISLLKDGNIFNCQYQENNLKEEIAVKPFIGSIYHHITIGDYDMGKESYPYELYTGIFDKDTSNTLIQFKREEEGRYNLNYYNQEIDRLYEYDSENDLIQKGKKMQEIDYTFVKRIETIKNLFNIDDTNLLNNLIELIYQNYSTEEILALLGLEKISSNTTELINNYIQTKNNKRLIK